MTSADRTEPAPAAGRQVEPGARGRRPLGVWRIGTPLVVLLSGALFVVSGTTSEGTDLRPGRYTSLADLTEGASLTYAALQADVAAMQAEVDALTREVDDARVRQEKRRAQQLRAPAGLEPVAGPGVTIVLSDASEEQLEAAAQPDSGVDRDLLVVHQEDIQAVVNALWTGGAQAVTVQGQRIVTTTGIKCSGSAVQLQGVPYPEPYTIQAVGDPSTLVSSLDGNLDVSAYRSDVELGVGWSLAEEGVVEAPAYDGLLDIDLARPQPG